MRPKFAILLIVFCLSCKNVTSDPDPDPDSDSDPGKQDYLPLAVGNTWRFVISESVTNNTPNGSSTSTSSSSETWRVTSFQKVANERYRFIILVNEGKNIGDTISIMRDSTTFSIYPTVRTGVADTISTFISVYPSKPIKRTWVKGVGVIKDTWTQYIHITAGNTYNISGTRTLVAFSLKP